MLSVVFFFSAACATLFDPVFSGRPLMENNHLGLFQGDIRIRNRTKPMAHGRNAITNDEGRWPEAVVAYSLDDTYSDSDREIIESAIEEFEKHTCIRWVERTDEEYYVAIDNGIGCWSDLGRIGDVQSLTLQASVCMKKGIVMHEMMHTLGFLHEQNRPDRDDYVRVIWDNIINGMEPNFEKQTPMEMDDLGLDYDYGSIMHYTAYMFASDMSQPTLSPVVEGVSLEELGYGLENEVFTDLDIQKMNTFYECPSK